MALGCAACEVEDRELAGRDADLAGQMRHGVIGHFAQRPWERPRHSKNFSRTAKPSRIAPDLLRRSSSSSSTRVT